MVSNEKARMLKTEFEFHPRLSLLCTNALFIKFVKNDSLKFEINKFILEKPI